MSKSEALRKELKATVWPHFDRAGFVRGKATSLFVPFHRHVAGVVQVFEVQWDKHHLPRFVINFGEIPAERLAQRPGDDLQALELVNHSRYLLRLMRGRGGTMGSWYQLRKPLWEKMSTFSWSYTPSEVAAQVIANFSEVEAWWATKEIGPHIRVLRTSLDRDTGQALAASCTQD
jgi:hypothetical protein